MHLDGSYCPFRVGEMKATLLMHFNWSSILPGVVTAVLTRWSLRDKRRTAIQVFNIPLCVPLICSLVWSWIPRVPLLGSLARFSKPAPRIRSQYIIVQELPSLSFYRERSVTRKNLFSSIANCLICHLQLIYTAHTTLRDIEFEINAQKQFKTSLQTIHQRKCLYF